MSDNDEAQDKRPDHGSPSSSGAAQSEATTAEAVGGHTATHSAPESGLPCDDDVGGLTRAIKPDPAAVRPKGRPGRPALSDEAKALKKAERKAKKKAQGELGEREGCLSCDSFNAAYVVSA